MIAVVPSCVPDSDEPNGPRPCVPLLVSHKSSEMGSLGRYAVTFCARDWAGTEHRSQTWRLNTLMGQKLPSWRQKVLVRTHHSMHAHLGGFSDGSTHLHTISSSGISSETPY